MRVLVLHQHYWPEMAATAQILTDLCEDLVAAGDQVTVICGQPSYRAIGRRLPQREVHRGVAIERVWSYRPGKRAIPQRLAHYGTYFVSSLVGAACAHKPDVCFVMSTPPLLLGVSGTLLSLLRGVPFVYSVQDLYPDIAIHLGVIKENGLVARAVGTVAAHCYRKAAALVTLSSGMGGSLAAKGIAPERIHVIANWADTASVAPVARDNAFAREHKIDAGFVVQYAGNLGQSQGLEHVLGAAELLLDLPCTFVFAGDGNARAMLEAEAKRRSLHNVRFLPPQPRERLSELLGSCDLGLVPMKAGVGHDLVPSKLYGIMASGRPVVASVDADSEVARTVHSHNCGFVVEPESARALAAGIQRVFASTAAERHRLGQNGRTACVETYSRAALTRRYEVVLRQASGQPAQGTVLSDAAAVPARPSEDTWLISR